MDELVVLARQYGLERLLPFLTNLARPSIRLLETEEAGVVGCSRLGGLPDVAPDFRWPCLRDCNLSPQQADKVADLDAPMLFLGQLNWEQLNPYDLEGVLPASGGVLFFGVQGAEHSLVVPTDHFAPHPVAPPLELNSILPIRVLAPHFEWTLPYYGSYGSIGGGDSRQCFFDVLLPDLEFLELDATERKAYNEFRAHLELPGSPRHRVLGHPNYIQNPMHLDLERWARDLKLTYETYLTLCDPTEPLTRQLKRDALASNWQLAFQLAYLVIEDGMWDDAGTHYFWSKKSDLNSSRSHFLSDYQID